MGSTVKRLAHLGARASPSVSISTNSTATPSMNKEDTAITPADTAEVVDRNSTRDIYEEALRETLVTEREAAKRVIAEQIRQVESARMVLAAAEAKLARPLDKTPAEIAMMRSLR